MCYIGVAASTSREHCMTVDSSYLQKDKINLRSVLRDDPTRKRPDTVNDSMITAVKRLFSSSEFKEN